MINFGMCIRAGCWRSWLIGLQGANARLRNLQFGFAVELVQKRNHDANRDNQADRDSKALNEPPPYFPLFRVFVGRRSGC
jgi:hypothetical protein